MSKQGISAKYSRWALAQPLESVLDRGANPNQPLADGSLPISWAIERQDAKAVALLLSWVGRVAL